MLCAFCGRENDQESRFCIDCGKPLTLSAARAAAPVVMPAAATPAAPVATARESQPYDGYAPSVPPTRVSSGSTTACPKCGHAVNPSLPFCGYCGTKTGATLETASCKQCGATYTQGADLFCARCGSRVGQRVSVELSQGTLVMGAGRLAAGPKLALLGETGEVVQSYTLDRGEAVVGRGDADIAFADDHFMSPLHARLELREGQLLLRDLGSRNGSWIFIDKPEKLVDGDMLLVGSQVLRFRRLGYPGPHPPEADSTRRMGSTTPKVDVAVLEQLRADASVRDVFHLSPGRSVQLGREFGDWTFPYDATMSGRHAEVRSEDAEFFVHDTGSRNGVAMCARGERPVVKGQRLLIGDQILRVEQI